MREITKLVTEILQQFGSSSRILKRAAIIVLGVDEYGRLRAASRERFCVLPVYASDELCKHPLKLSRDCEPVRPRIRHQPVESTDRAWWKCSEDQLSKATVDRKSTRLNSSHRCISYAVF